VQHRGMNDGSFLSQAYQVGYSKAFLVAYIKYSRQSKIKRGVIPDAWFFPIALTSFVVNNQGRRNLDLACSLFVL